MTAFYIYLKAFVAESNRIEGIEREPTQKELKAHLKLLMHSRIRMEDLMRFVSVVAPGNRLRIYSKLNVSIGAHDAPPGGPAIGKALDILVAHAIIGTDPTWIHKEYERLHPFTDGNGRSGRVLWLWCMKRAGRLDEALSLGFLRLWYYESLSAYDAERRD